MVGNRHEYAIMNACENDLWWYKNLHINVLNKIRESFGDKKDITIVDAGCGTGGLISFLRTSGYFNITGYDISEDAISFCKAKGLNAFQKDAQFLHEIIAPGTVDVIINNDMLYFFENETRKKVVYQFSTLLRSNGICIFNLPALSVFSGTHDHAVGIKKRFELKESIALINQNGFKIKNYSFWPFLVSPMILAVRLIQQLKIKLKIGHSDQSDVGMPNKYINSILFHVTKFENRLPIKKFFGSSLLIVAAKNNTSNGPSY